jgi:hypothetical protein
MVGAAGQFGIDGDQILNLANLGRQNDRLRGKAGFLGEFGGSRADWMIASRVTSRALIGEPAWFSSISRVSSTWSSDPQLTPMRTGLSYGSPFR